MPSTAIEERLQGFRGAGHHGLVPPHDDGTLDEPGVLRHQVEELGVGMAAGVEAVGLVGGVVLPQDLAR